ncbi:MAG: sulfatase-like hydrolase/transferase, partial [Acidobacteriaceae bacterium]
MQDQHRPISITELFRRIPAHPFFLAAYPIISLLAFNISQIYTRDAVQPLEIVLLSTAIILVLLRLLTRSWQIAGMLTSLAVVWFFVYGHLYNQLKSFSLFGLIVGRHRYLLVAWTVLIIALAFWLVKRFHSLPNLTMGLNLISIILVCLSLTQIGIYKIRNQLNQNAPTDIPALISWDKSSRPPDIYFIVLDGYARSDTLERTEGIDNSAFVKDLEGMGFYVAKCSQSNYTRTLLSLGSTFNMQYVQSLNTQLRPDQDPSWLVPYFKHGIVRQQLEQLGYKTIVFKNPWEAWVWDDASIVYRSSGRGLLSPFEYLLLSTTVTRFYLDQQQAGTSQLANYTNYEDTLYALDQLQKVPDISGPKFVFVHLVIPHAPFVFGPDGEYIDIRPYDTVRNLYTDEDHRRGYTAAVTYIDKRMLEILPRLIQGSATPPIIVLIGDHGTGDSTTVTQNLEAFFTPGSSSPFYANITPVNIFRVVFDTYFNGNFGQLEDHSYFSAEGKYFNFWEIPNKCT